MSILGMSLFGINEYTLRLDAPLLMFTEAHIEAYTIFILLYKGRQLI